MGYITPVPADPHPLDVEAALGLIDINLEHALKQVSYWTARAAELATARTEWSAKA